MKILQGVAILTWVALGVVSISTTLTNSAIKGQVAAQRQFIEQREALIDSLHAELFIANSTLGRYELSLDYLNSVNPHAFGQFSQYYNHETE
jgi:hypothetical protein